MSNGFDVSINAGATQSSFAVGNLDHSGTAVGDQLFVKRPTTAWGHLGHRGVPDLALLFEPFKKDWTPR